MFAAFSSSFMTTPGITSRIQLMLSLYGRTWIRENSSIRCSPRIEAYRMFVSTPRIRSSYSEPLRRRRESDRFDEARAEEGGIQPVQVFRGVFEHLDPERGRGAEDRSEERRVGKECRSRWPPEHEKKTRRTRQTGMHDGRRVR